MNLTVVQSLFDLLSHPVEHQSLPSAKFSVNGVQNCSCFFATNDYMVYVAGIVHLMFFWAPLNIRRLSTSGKLVVIYRHYLVCSVVDIIVFLSVCLLSSTIRGFVSLISLAGIFFAEIFHCSSCFEML